MQLTKTIFQNSAIFNEKKWVENRLWGKSAFLLGKGINPWAEAEAALCRDRVWKEHMEDPDDDEKMAAALACMQETHEPPAIFGYLGD